MEEISKMQQEWRMWEVLLGFPRAGTRAASATPKLGIRENLLLNPLGALTPTINTHSPQTPLFHISENRVLTLKEASSLSLQQSPLVCPASSPMVQLASSRQGILKSQAPIQANQLSPPQVLIRGRGRLLFWQLPHQTRSQRSTSLRTNGRG